jgi:hypothetical protein
LRDLVEAGSTFSRCFRAVSLLGGGYRRGFYSCRGIAGSYALLLARCRSSFSFSGNASDGTEDIDFTASDELEVWGVLDLGELGCAFEVA